jgi:beta-lactamase regulating signal transducer with metallopeptidase domain
MNLESLPTLFGGALGVVLFVVGVVWLVLWLAVPFMIYFILHRLRRIHEDLYAKQVEANRLLAESLKGPPRVPQAQAWSQECEETRNPFK